MTRRQRAIRHIVALGVGLILLAVSVWLLLGPVTPRGGSLLVPDKLAHALLFAGLGVPLLLAKLTSDVRMLAVLALYGAGIEGIQPIFGRSRDLGDMLANIAGLAVALALAHLARRLNPWRARPLPAR